MKSNISKKVIIRYSLLQLPGLLFLVVILLFIQRWIVIPDIIFWGIILAWVAKDVILFFYTWKAYEWKKKDKMVGMQGVAMEKIIESGYIFVNNEKWLAVNHGDEPVEEGETAHIHDRKGLTLFIKKIT
ncbi:NfeD family protein [Thermodesulfobacteriota bacterium]